MISFKKSLSLLLGASLAATCLLTGCSQSEQTYAKVSAIDGSTLALALGTLDTSGMSGDSAPPSGQQGGPPQGTPPALPSGAASSDGQTPPSGAPQDGGGAPNSVGGPGGAQGGFTESGQNRHRKQRLQHHESGW